MSSDLSLPRRRASQTAGDAVESGTAVGRLKSYIQDGSHRPGAKLPPERILAGELGVGRPALREAIKALSILDILESRRGDGTYLKSLKAFSVGWPNVVEIHETAFNMLDLLEVRKMLEPIAARLATTRASEYDLREIADLRQALDDAAGDWRQIIPLDVRLHNAILRASGNAYLEEINLCLAPHLERLRSITASRAADTARMSRDHGAIVDAILRGEAENAFAAMLEHLHHIGLDLISNRKRPAPSRLEKPTLPRPEDDDETH